MSKFFKSLIPTIFILSGVIAYGQGLQSLNQLSIQDNTGIEYLGHTLWTEIRDVFATDHLYALYNNTLVIYDLTNPDLPVQTDYVFFPGQGQRLYAAGNYVYVAGGDEGIFIFDVSPSGDGPNLIGQYQTPGFARDIVVEGNLALVADSDSGLVLVDISSPEQPIGRGSYQGLADVYHVCAEGTLVCLADTVSQVRLISIYDPEVIIPLGNYTSPDHIHELDINCSYLYLVSDTTHALQIIDIGTPSSPSLSGTYSSYGVFSNIQVMDTLAYILDFNQLKVFNVANPSDPVLVGEAGNSCGGPVAMSPRFAVNNNRSYSCNLGLDYCNYMCVADISDPYAPLYVAGEQRCIMPVAACIRDTVAFITSQSGNFCFLNIKDPTRPEFINDTWTSAYAYGVEIQGDFAYVAAGFRGLDIFDISDLDHPLKYSSQISDEVAFVTNFEIRDTLVYLAAGSGDWGGLCIVNVSTPYSVSVVSRNTKTNAHDIIVKNNLAYVVDMFSGLHIYDISDPTATAMIGEILLPPDCRQVAVQDSLAFVCNDSGLYIVNVVNPEIPALLSVYPTSRPVYGVFVRDSLIYLANEQTGIQVLNVKNPTAPVWLETYDTPGKAESIIAEDSLLVVVDGYSLLFLDDPYYDPCCQGLTGNVNCSEEEDPDIADITALIDHLYLSHEPLCCPEEAECNGVGDYPDIADITAIISYLYLSHEPLSACP